MSGVRTCRDVSFTRTPDSIRNPRQNGGVLLLHECAVLVDRFLVYVYLFYVDEHIYVVTAMFAVEAGFGVHGVFCADGKVEAELTLKCGNVGNDLVLAHGGV